VFKLFEKNDISWSFSVITFIIAILGVPTSIFGAIKTDDWVLRLLFCFILLSMCAAILALYKSKKRLIAANKTLVILLKDMFDPKVKRACSPDVLISVADDPNLVGHLVSLGLPVEETVAEVAELKKMKWDRFDRETKAILDNMKKSFTEKYSDPKKSSQKASCNLKKKNRKSE
jgi:hypothetical protein